MILFVFEGDERELFRALKLRPVRQEAVHSCGVGCPAGL